VQNLRLFHPAGTELFYSAKLVRVLSLKELFSRYFADGEEGVLIFHALLYVTWVKRRVLMYLVLARLGDLAQVRIASCLILGRPCELRKNAAIRLQQLLVNLVILAHDAGSHRRFHHSLLDGLAHVVGADVVRQRSDALVVAAAEGTLHRVFLAVRVLVEHGREVGHFVVLEMRRDVRSPIVRAIHAVGERAAVLVIHLHFVNV